MPPSSGAPAARQAAGAALSIGGVVLVMCKGRWHDLIGLHWAPGDLLMLLAALACDIAQRVRAARVNVVWMKREVDM